MKIVVLDGRTLNPGDLSWDDLADLGQFEVYDRSTAQQVVARSRGAGIVLTNKVAVTAEAMAQLSDLKYIGVTATGYNIVDVRAADERGIIVTNVPTYGTDSVAQMVFAHLLNFTQRVGDHAQSVREGDWSSCEDFCYWNIPLVELSALTMGIVGLGRIGRAVARIAQTFGMNTIAYDPYPPDELPNGVRMVTLDELFQEADVISLHCPLTDETKQLVNRERLDQMKPSAILINTSRGPLIDENALVEALDAGRIAGAGLDVLSVEPPPSDHPLFHAPNAFITPHIAWATRSARQRLMGIAVDNVRAFLAGNIQNAVGNDSFT